MIKRIINEQINEMLTPAPGTNIYKSSKFIDFIQKNITDVCYSRIAMSVKDSLESDSDDSWVKGFIKRIVEE